MSHSYVNNLMHCIFSTKDRWPLIGSDLERRLWPYLGGIARENRMVALAIGGTADHGWQEGYGAFSVSASQASKTIAYINDQKNHHHKKSFEEEFLDLLKKHGIEYDSRYVF